MLKPMDWMCLFYIYFLILPTQYVASQNDYAQENVMQSYKVAINTKQYMYKTDERFLSIALGSSLIRRGWENFNFSSAKLQNLAKGLAPAFLRIGGTDADFLLF